MKLLARSKQIHKMGVNLLKKNGSSPVVDEFCGVKT